jgi:two-component system response regulator MprA
MPKKILIVDDDVDLVHTLARVLETGGYAVARAHNARDGLRRLLEEKPDLLLLDVMMETDTAGFEMVYQIRSRRTGSRYRSFQELPIILLTAINQATNSRFSLNERDSFLPQIQDFLTKPVRVEDLLAKVEMALGGQAS